MKFQVVDVAKPCFAGRPHDQKGHTVVAGDEESDILRKATGRRAKVHSIQCLRREDEGYADEFDEEGQYEEEEEEDKHKEHKGDAFVLGELGLTKQED